MVISRALKSLVEEPLLFIKQEPIIPSLITKLYNSFILNLGTTIYIINN
jgi:hypothetical protein